MLQDECANNPQFMLQHCRKSCGFCELRTLPTLPKISSMHMADDEQLDQQAEGDGLSMKELGKRKLRRRRRRKRKKKLIVTNT